MHGIYLEHLKHKKIGIWGFGVTGQSVLRYLYHIPCVITIFEQKELSVDCITIINQYGAHVWKTDNPLEFLENQDLIIPSPGVDLSLYQAYHHKIVTEVDLFQSACTTKTIAITGAVGKTSITHLLGQLIQATPIRAHVGGNIGVGLLDLLANHCDLFIIELSSFQLEYSLHYAPDIAIVTNLYPNHLDRHQTIERYFNAKFSMIKRQKKDHIALMPATLIKQCNALEIQSTRYFFSWSTPTKELLDQLHHGDGLFFIQDSMIILQKGEVYENIISVEMIPRTISLQENWLILYSVLYLMNIPLTVVEKCRHNLSLPADRLEKIATINEITFFNDSKSTTNESTMAAVQALHEKPIHLFLGGLSKGVARQPLIAYLKNRVAHIYCFGKEAEDLYALCIAHEIPCSLATTLTEIFDLCIHNIRPHDYVLFSPGGTSYDLFKDYKERGQTFKQMVHRYSTIIHNR